MKISNCLISLVILVAGAGCRTADTHSPVATSSISRVDQAPAEQSKETSAAEPAGQIVQRGAVGDYTYTVAVIPNQHLSATSREGDKPAEVYSSNIIAVYVHPRNGVTVSSTNSAGLSPGNTLEPAKK
jgi:hypothetical protein